MSTTLAPPPAPPRDGDHDYFGREPEPDPQPGRRERFCPWDLSRFVDTVGVTAPVYRAGFGSLRRRR